MSGAEADISSDGETSFEDEDVPLPPSPLKEGTDEPFLVVLKGGSPWGFTLQSGSESKAAVLISHIDREGKAWHSGNLRVGDYVLQVNEVRCMSVQVAQELVDSAFRTLTLLVWRGTSDSLSPPVRSASFLQKTRELSERARQAAVQDDSVLFSESKSSAARMKPRQRRIESFHGGRRGSTPASSSSPASTSASSTPRPSQHGDSNPVTPPTSSSDTAKAGLKGWATEHDLTSSRKPVIMSGSHVTRNVPLTPAKSTPSLNQDDLVNSTPRGYNPKSPTGHNSMTKSTTDIPEHVNYENVTSPTSPKSPSWYQQKFSNRPVFDFSSSTSSRRTSGSPRNSYAGGSPRNSYASGSPRNSYAGGSPRNSYAGYSSSYVPSNYPQSPVSGFAPQSLPGNMFSQTFTESLRNSANFVQNQKPSSSSSRTYSHDDTPTHPTNKNYDRRSLPPQALQQFRQEFQRENTQESPKPLTNMPVTHEEEELDREVSDIKPGLHNDFDRRPMYSPPAPPVRDISSLKYVSYSRQNHEKYPSWPVTAAQPPQNLGPPIDTQQREKSSDCDSRTDSDNGSKIQVQAIKPEGKRSPNADRRGEDSKQTRNQSDPGFKQRPKKSFYTTRKPKEPSVDNSKPEGERFEEFYSQSKPGYPPPKLDPDGHNYGDEKYSIPSPPERDMPGLDEKSLVQKIAAVISPHSSYQPSYNHTFQYNMAAENNQSHNNIPSENNRSLNSESGSKSQSYKIPGTYFQQAMNAQNILHPKSSQIKNVVDSGTSPLQSPTEEKGRFIRSVNSNARNEMVSPKPRGVIVTQRPYYNTSTQTDESLGNQSDISNSDNTNGSVSSASAMRSDASTYSSGIGSMTFSDHSSAPMLRKLSEEFYRGKLSGTVPNEKRMSSASTNDELKSPRSDHMFGELKEAESYSSVVIHAHEPGGLFGRDEVSSPSTSSRTEVSDGEHELTYKPRYSMDAGMLLHKSNNSRGLNESRFTSESNLSGGNYVQRNHSQSLIQLNRPSSSLGEATQSRPFSQSTYSSSSSSSRPQGSMEARSSGSRVSSDSSNKGDKSRIGSDSVFYGNTSPVPGDNKDKNSENGKTATLGRKESMKMAYGTYDENEHHYATPYAHQRNSSEVLSSNVHDPNAAHGRSMSFTDYMPMHYGAGETNRLGQIKEEGSEIRWQEAVNKSKSLSRVNASNYENVNLVKEETSSAGNGGDSDKSDAEKKKESKSGLRRFASEQLRPKKQDRQQKGVDSSKSGSSSSGGESSKGNKSDSENVPKSLSHHNMSDSDLKRVQQKALLDFVERKIEKTKAPDTLELQIAKPVDMSPEFPPPPPPQESTSPVTVLPPQPVSPFADITKRYNYTKAQRNESLRRTQSIASNDSASDYMQMKRSEHSHQTEWSRLRSQDGGMPRRPLSIGSDIGSIDHQHSLSAGTTPDGEPIHQRSSSETLPKHILAEQDRQESILSTVIPPQVNNDGMVTSPIYHNLAGNGDYPRRPPPPVPGINEEAPPALPPRSGQRFNNSKSESFLFNRVDPKQRDELKASYTPDGAGTSSGTSRWDSTGTGTLREDAYAQQLRKQARRFSEQHKPISMQVVSTKSTVQVSLSQSYRQEPASVLEAVPVSDLTPTSPTQAEVKSTMLHLSPPYTHDRITPEPPPLPTPMKNGETEIAVDLNTTADFPPPPVEFMGNEEHNDRCADDSYGSYKTRTAPREVGKYKRTTSDSSLLRSHQEHQPFQPHPDLNSRDVAETIPNKPPRKKLELQGRESPTQGYRSNSPSMLSADSKLTNQKPAPQIQAMQAVEVITVQHAQRSVARPLQSGSAPRHSPPPNTSTGGIVSTVVQRPTMNQQDKNSNPDEPRQSVKDRVKNIEVFTHSPSLSKGSRQGNTVLDEKPVNAEDSLEQLECSIKSSDSFTDRLRPVVKRSEPDAADRHTPPERVSTDTADIAKLTPPVVPNRTYLQKPGGPPEPEYRNNSFQNRAGPRPFVNKSSEGANIHNPLQNHVVEFKHGSRSEAQRGHGQSVPEPQVPVRPQKRGTEQYRDQNSDVASQDSRLVSNHEENVQNSGVQSGNKRNYENSFSRTRTSSGSNSSHISDNHQSDKNVASFHNRYPASSPHEQTKGDYSHRNVQRAGTPQDHRHVSHDQRTPDQNRNSKDDSRNWRSNLKHSENHSSNQTNNVSESNNRRDSHHHPGNSTPVRPQEIKTISEKDVSSLPQVTINHGRQPSAEELECDKKAQELAQVLKDSDKQLSEVLTSDSKKIRMQYLDGILPVEPEVNEERRPRSATRTGSASDDKKEKEDEPTSPMPSNYYVSPPKAMIELEIRKFGDQLTQDIGDNDALAQKKEELLERMIKKVDVLKDDRKELLTDIEENETLGKQVIAFVEKKCRNQQEKDKYKSYIEDIDKIIRLLLKLSGLLARAENTIQGLNENTNDKIKKMTYDKRDRLYQQHEDAKELKTDIDRRSEQVEAILQECLSPVELEDYHYYIKMKSKYTIQMQELEDKITLGNEQIAALQKSIPNKTKS